MRTANAKSGKYSPSATFSTLYRAAYRRIWSSNALKIWEGICWSIPAAYLALYLFSLRINNLENYMVYVAWLGVPYLSFLLIGAWVYRVHVTVGTADETLRTIPQITSMILLPRMSAVIVSLVQFLAPMILILIVFHDILLSGHMGRFGHAEPRYGIGLAAITGWILSLLIWAFFTGSMVMRRGGSFLFAYTLPLLIFIVLSSRRWADLPGYTSTFRVIIDFFIGRDSSSDEQMWPNIIQFSGLIGIFVFPFVYLFALREWERPER